MMISENQKEHRNEIIAILRKERNAKYYEQQKTNRKTCEVCACDVLPTYWKKHILTKRHSKWAGILEEKKAKELAEELAKPKKRGRKAKSTQTD
jgi:predicted HTH transcriptional regulator